MYPSQEYPAIRDHPIYILIQTISSHTPPLQRMIDAMKAHHGNPYVNLEACTALGNLANNNAANRAAITEAGGIMVC